jgi:hypothetical protein
LLGERAELVPMGEKEGMKLGASAFSFFPLDGGIATAG